MAVDIDEDGNGIVEQDEFLSMFSTDDNMEDVARTSCAKAETEANKLHTTVEPTNSYYSKGKRLVLSQVRFQSKGTLLGGSKDRVDTLTFQRGLVEAHRYDRGVGHGRTYRIFKNEQID